MATQTYDAAGAGLLPSGVLQPYGQNILKYGIGQLGTPIDVGAMTAKVAGPTGFQQKSQQRLADMYGMGDIQRDATGMLTGFTGGTGIASYQPYLDQISQQNLLDPSKGYQDFMSPYQKEIIDTTMQEYDLQAGRGRQQIRENAMDVGAFGGARQGVEMGEYQSGSDRNRAALLASLQGQGYEQAINRQRQQLADLQQMGTYQTGMEAQGIAGMEAVGAQAQALEQQKLNQLAAAGQTAYTLPMNRLTDVANIYGSIAGAMPGSPTQKFQPSPVATGIGGFANMWSVLNNPDKNVQNVS
jgi:Arc/MetJ-type ribon-helix-helix transcriptional regulator